MAKGDEKRFVECLMTGMPSCLQPTALEGVSVKVCSGYRLSYTNEILQYSGDDVPASHSAGYETDLLVYDQHADGAWIPRIVIECKRGSLTTHDALTYSAKAATHKHVHPYLRYGILIGDWGGLALPARLARHGAYFDFMAVLEETEPNAAEWTELGGLLRQEVVASRQLQALLSDRGGSRPLYRLLHRPLVLTP